MQDVESGTSEGQSRRAAVVTAIGTLLLVAVEFALLTGVYHLDDRADRRHETYRTASARVDTWRPGTPVEPVVSAVRALRRSGADDAESLAPDLAAFADQPGLTTSAALERQVETVGAGTAAAQREVDLEAAIIHASLLIAVSIGWFFWFRRLVRRQRALERCLTETQLAVESEQRLTALVRNSADVVTVLDAESTVTFVSPALKTVLGYDPEFLTGTRLVEMLRPGDAETLAVLLTGCREGDQPVVFGATHADGRDRVIEGTLTNLLADPAVNGWVLTTRDVTERLALQGELQHQASHDALTGLANRRLFGERLDHALRPRSTHAEQQAVLFLDLDDFKEVNDNHGHGIGDRLLLEVAERITLTMREEDTTARLGGDEFAVLMEDTDLDTAQDYAERVSRALAAPVEIDGGQYPVRASIGIAQATPGASTGEETLRNADIAMYWAKDRGKGTVAIYEVALHTQAQQRMALLHELQHAIDSDQLVLHFQPTVDLTTRQITGFEALVRWEHPERGMVPPVEFIPLAEQTGLIVPLGSWVLRQACLAGVLMQSADHHPSMAVNVAARQLVTNDFVEEVFEVLRETGMPADKLVLEITESTLLDDRERVIAALGALRARGIRVAIDDFGTGYSSLAYLADLPVDVLKLDKSFVDRVCEEEGRSSLVEAIITMGESLHLTTVAEGVERPEQATRLERAHCALGQGYLWSRPVDLDAATRLLHEAGDTGLLTDPGAVAPSSPERPLSPARTTSA